MSLFYLMFIFNAIIRANLKIAMIYYYSNPLVDKMEDSYTQCHSFIILHSIANTFYYSANTVKKSRPHTLIECILLKYFKEELHQDTVD